MTSPHIPRLLLTRSTAGLSNDGGTGVGNPTIA